MARRGPKPKRTGGASWGDFEPPKNLDAVARAEFGRLTGALAAVGTLDRTDPRLVVAAARTHALLERAHAELAEGGGKLTLTAANGTLMAHPLLGVVGNLTLRVKSLWYDMGLTPASAKLGTAAPGDDGEWAGLLSVHG